MRKGFFFSSLFIAAASAAAIILYLNAPVARAITGYVFRGGGTASGGPITGANISLSPGANDTTLDKLFRRATQTDNHGWFTFTDLPEGHFQIEVTTNDGMAETVNNVARGMNNLMITLRPPK